MKIEIGESLVYSFLKHEKQCLIAQTNWKSSGKWEVSETAKDDALKAFERINQYPEFKDIFKKSNFEQTLKQAEIDVLGMDAEQHIYAFEVAFHENGLQYGGKIATRDRVFKKLLRAYIILKYYFPEQQHIIGFCSPKINPATEEHIKDYFKILKDYFEADKVKFEYYANEKFTTDIVEKVIAATADEADSSELFARAVKLLKISERFITKQPNQHTQNAILELEQGKGTTANNTKELFQNLDANNNQNGNNQIDRNTQPIFINNIEIPTHPEPNQSFQNWVKDIMRLLFDNNLLTAEISNLQETQYCRDTFGLSFPMIAKVGGDFQRERYWRETFNNNQFRVCSQWWRPRFAQYQEKIIEWLDNLQN